MDKLYKDSIDNPATALDFAIRDAQNEYEYGYEIPGKEPYYNYLSNLEWCEFKKSMSALHQAQYKDADGGELDEKNSRYGMLPPKMASFGSSSRLIYECSKAIPNFTFEKLLPTRVGHTANLDGYLATEENDIFVEAKCREIYSSHANQKISVVYKNLYNRIHQTNESFGYKQKYIPKDDEHFKCTFTWRGREISRFDIKQLLCHFLGISANIFENGANPNVRFVYLLFNPYDNTDFSNDKIADFRKKITDVYDQTLEEIKLFGDFKWLFDIVMDYQSRLRVGEPMPAYDFHFELVDQNKYKERFRVMIR